MSTTPNLGLTKPTAAATPGPGWALELNGDLDLLDAHDHTPGKGAPIPSAGLNINADVDFKGSGANNIKALLFEGGAIETEPGALYVDEDGELAWVGPEGESVRLTSGGGLNLTWQSGINGQYATDAAHPSVFYTTSLKRYTLTYDGSNAASVKMGGLLVGVATKSTGYTVTDTDGLHTILCDTATAGFTVTLPVAANNPGRILTIKDKTNTAGTHNITLARQSTDTIDGSTSKTISASYGWRTVISNGTLWYIIGSG